VFLGRPKLIPMSATYKPIMMITLLLAAAIPGCLFEEDLSFPKCSDKDDCITIAFESKEEYRNTEESPQKLADKIEEILKAQGSDTEVEIYPVSGPSATIEALRFGHADIGFLDGGAAWLSWQNYGLEVLGAEQKADGRAYYNAVAWVHIDSDMAKADLDNDSSTDPYALMQGKTSCHTSALGSSGMLLPMGYLISNGYVEVQGDPDEIDSLTDTVRTHFSENSSIPNSGTKYYKYIGSLRCLAEHEGGTSNDYISFAKDPTVPDYCGDEPESWCFDGDFDSTEDFYPLGGYSDDGEIPGFGRAPSHPIMYNPDYFSSDDVAQLQMAFATMNMNADGVEVLDEVLSSPGITIINTTEHLGTYGDAIEDVPGISAYFESKAGKVSIKESVESTTYTTEIASAIVLIGLVGVIFYFKTKKQNPSTEEIVKTEIVENEE